MAFNLIAMIGKAAAGKWDLPHGMLGLKSAPMTALDPALSTEREVTGYRLEHCLDA